MTLRKSLAVSSLSLALAVPAFAQQMPQGQAPSAEEQVAQLDQMVDLDQGQEQELVTLLSESRQRIQSLRSEAQEVQMRLQQNAGPEFDEAAIRQDAELLGDLTGEMTAESVLMQSRMQAALSPAQRDELERQIEERQQQMRQMQQQMQQQQAPAQ
ncbi:MAG: Spy/CpxP family protein refolding chaperone [Pseudomonadota bacterium]